MPSLPPVHVSRRSIARGAAWSVPVVAVGVAVPAFAVSPAGVPAGSLAKSCKCPGSGGNNYDFKTVLSFAGTTGTYSVVINSWSFDGVTQPLPTPNLFTLTNGTGKIILVTNLNNSASKHDATVSYTITDSATSATDTESVSITQMMYPPNCPALGGC